MGKFWMFKWTLLLGLLGLLPAASEAILWRADRSRDQLNQFASEQVTIPVGAIRHSGARSDSGSAILVEDKFIVTAAHMMPPTGTLTVFEINGQSYVVEAWVRHEKFKKAGQANDVAVGRLAERVLDVAPADLASNAARNQAVLIAGCGGSGPFGADLSWNWQPLIGTNILSAVSSTQLKTTFDRPSAKSATAYESQLVPGDSGGGLFVQEGGAWKLAGISVSRSSANYGGSATYTRVGSVETWIESKAWESGRVELDLDLQDFESSVTGIVADIEFVVPNTDLPVLTTSVPIATDGTVSFNTSLCGTYDVVVHAGTWLEGRIASWSVNGQRTGSPILSLLNGDLDGSGTIDSGDLQIINQNIGQSATRSAAQQLVGDVNGDGIVDSEDIAIVTQNLGRHSH